MILSSDSGQQDLISQSKMEHHNIQKYQFKSIGQEEAMEDKKQFQEAFATPDVANQTPSINNSFEKELVEKLLQKTDELASSLAKMQLQVEKQQLDMEERISTARSDAYKDGLREGEEKIKKELLESVEKEKQSLINAVIALEKSLKLSEEKIKELEQDLAQIAIDMAREVIVKEVEENSQKIAISLAHHLMESMRDITQVELRVNTLDYPYLRENLDLKNVEIQADDNIAKGGVVIASKAGNIDGNVMTRFRVLKQNVLDNTIE
ncbi:flagellar assembly protein FliH [Helicobacter sp. faydin-H20]|uniref:flagellar assembly protein FliH n=1 Tax=Helicobacter anatolicus TaxID=2905874 RepID=UPI001E559260|nr:flagellar assembly protein FliH [Helicobacter anatolicus]MCE3037559.1 flagellar assembly protein FliH [Helicobacter anatolicus]